MLTERQKNIMIAIVEGYTENENAEPIGSNTLTKQEGLNCSTATLRNEMAALEEMGYLEKTHTSSGRIPTEKGYRLYVNELMNIDSLKDELKDQVTQVMEDSKEPKKVALEKVLSTVIDNKEFSYGAVLLEKTAFNASIKKLDFVYLKNYQGIFILVTDKGHVLYRETRIPEGINVTNIQNTTEYLNKKLHNVLLNDLKNVKYVEIYNDEFFDLVTNARAVLEFILINLFELVEDKRKVIGQYNILVNHDEFADVKDAQAYLEALKDGSIYSLAEFDNGPLPVIASNGAFHVSVKIGSENKLDVMKKCSSITAIYVSDEETGAITIYGPMRMKYRYIISLLYGIVNNIN